MKSTHLLILVIVAAALAALWFFRDSVAAFFNGQDVGSRGNLPPPAVQPPATQTKPKTGLSGKDALVLGGSAACAAYFGPSAAPLCGAAAGPAVDLFGKAWDYLT